jgi:hypothetical protein
MKKKIALDTCVKQGVKDHMYTPLTTRVVHELFIGEDEVMLWMTEMFDLPGNNLDLGLPLDRVPHQMNQMR